MRLSDAWCPPTPAGLQSGVNAEAISHEDYLNAPGESFSVTFDTAGSYSYYCEPHQGAGMAGELPLHASVGASVRAPAVLLAA